MLQKYIYSLINCVTGYVEDETKELLELQVLPEYRWSMRLRVTHSFY